jgi:hypothetical protein
VVEHAGLMALEALDGATRAGDSVAPAVERLGVYYDPEGNYAGQTYLGIEPHDPGWFTVADLYAVTLLRVDIDALATRRFTEPGPARARLTELLGDVPADVELADADASILAAMAALHDEVKRTLAPRGKESTSSKWVTAAKLCARKRPNLFPVRDSVIREQLGIDRFKNDEVDYQVFRGLMRDQEVQQALSTLIDRVSRKYPERPIDTCRLESWTSPSGLTVFGGLEASSTATVRPGGLTT